MKILNEEIENEINFKLIKDIKSNDYKSVISLIISIFDKIHINIPPKKKIIIAGAGYNDRLFLVRKLGLVIFFFLNKC